MSVTERGFGSEPGRFFVLLPAARHTMAGFYGFFKKIISIATKLSLTMQQKGKVSSSILENHLGNMKQFYLFKMFILQKTKFDNGGTNATDQHFSFRRIGTLYKDSLCPYMYNHKGEQASQLETFRTKCLLACLQTTLNEVYAATLCVLFKTS